MARRTPLVGIEEVLRQRRLQLLAGRARCLVLRDQAAHPDHVRERPVRHSLAVGEAAAPVPVHLSTIPSKYL